MAAWTSNGQDGSGKGIYAQIINASDGTRVDGEFRINVTLSGDQEAASVAVRSPSATRETA